MPDLYLGPDTFLGPTTFLGGPVIVTKQTGLGDRLFVAGYNLSGDITALGNIGGGPAALDATGIDKSGFERVGGIRDGRIEATSWFNPGPEANAAHLNYKLLPVADQILTYCRGTALGAPAAGLVGKQVDYAGSRGNDGAFTFEVSTQIAAGIPLEWGVQATAGIRTDTTGTNGASVDLGAAGENGLQAYLHVFALTGTSVTVKLQSSSDSGAGDAWTDITGGAFAAATGVGAQRIETATSLAVERYVRVVSSGTFTNAQFAVLVVRNEIARDY